MSPEDYFAVRFFILSLIRYIFDHLDFLQLNILQKNHKTRLYILVIQTKFHSTAKRMLQNQLILGKETADSWTLLVRTIS